MKLLIVAMSDSIHTARWIKQIANQGWDIHLFPSIDYGVIHPEIENVTVHHSFYGVKKNKKVKIKGVPLHFGPVVFLARETLKKVLSGYRVIQLKRLIKKIQPDIIHSLEIQHAGYLTMDAKRGSRGKFPPWIVTNWGSDVYLFGRLAEHESKIMEVLSACNYYSCECYRDVKLADKYGLTGEVLPVFPNTGGFDIGFASQLRQTGPVSNRRTIMLKGYQTWAGRALVGMRALERCADLLNGYQIAIFSASSDVLIVAELFTKTTGIPTVIIPKETPHNEILKWHGKARISIGLSISDAISTSLLEAMLMGSFPIQSCTACADEWIIHGQTGIIVPPEDPDIIEQAIRRALMDDVLVNKAAEHNFIVAKERMDSRKLKIKAVEMYENIIKIR